MISLRRLLQACEAPAQDCVLWAILDTSQWCDSCDRDGEEDGATLLTPAELYQRLEAVAGADAVKEPELVLVSLWRPSLLHSQSPRAWQRLRTAC